MPSAIIHRQHNRLRFFQSWTRVLLLTLMTLFFAQAAAAQDFNTLYTTQDTWNSPIKRDPIREFYTNADRLNVAPTGSGVYKHQFIALQFDNTNTGIATISQTLGGTNQDSVMLIYEGSFDPTQPALNLFAFDDNSGAATDVCGSAGACPQISKEFAVNKKYIVVITTKASFLTLTHPIKVNYHNAAGITWSVWAPAAAPEAPTNLVATPGDGQVSVAFTAPADGGSAITGYEYQVTTPGGPGAWTDAAVTASPVVITGQTNGTLIGIKLRAKNAVGAGTESASVNATPTAPTSLVLAAPKNLGALPDDGMVTLNFEMTDSDYETSKDYEYQLDGGTWTKVGQNWYPFAIYELDNETTYTVKVRGVDANGVPGPASDAVTFTVNPATITDYETKDSDVLSEMSLDTSYLDSTPTGVGDNPYSYVAVKLTATEAGYYNFGQAEGSTDTVMIAYDGDFDPADPTANAIGFNDDSDNTLVCGDEGNCPSLFLSMTEGQTITVVITTFYPNNDGGDLVLPISFFAAGPGEVTFESAGPVPTASDAPTDLVATPSAGQLSVAFTAPESDGGAEITDYKYQLNGGAWVSAGVAVSPVVIKGLTNGTSYSVKLLAVNAAGESPESDAVIAKPGVAPGAPTNLVTTRGDKQLSVAFTKPANSGSEAITDYEYQLDGGEWVSAASARSPVVITGLTNGTEYKVALRAVNIVGASLASTETTGKPATAPLAPKSLDATRSDTQISVAFTAPTNTGGEDITDYEYQLSGGNWVGDWISAGVKASPVVIKDLTNGTNYSVKLRAVNAVGGGAESTSVTSKPATTPDAPTAVVATRDDTQVSVAFVAPEKNGGEVITDYKYQLDGGAWVSAGSTSSPIVIKGLTNGTTYSIKLRAVNAVGDGTESAAATSKPAAKPGVPSALVATRGNAQVSVAFTAPNDGGEAITDYEYQLINGNVSTDWISAGVKASPVVITGLTNGTTYSIKLRAVNAVGKGAESVSVTGKPATTANAPTALVATPSDGQVSVAFTAPDNGGEPITDYKYQLDGGDWVSAGSTNSPIVIKGLTNGADHSIKLRAVNMIGDGPESAAVSFKTPAPADVFAQNEDVIRNVVVDDASRSLQSTVTFNSQMTRDARTRFISGRTQGAGPSGGAAKRPVPANDNIAFDVDGMVEANGLTLSTRGKFFGQEGTTEARRLVFGDFDLQHDGGTGSTTLSFTGRMAWEKMTSADTMLGYFIGGELGQSNIGGTFGGNQDKLGLIAGGYGTHSLSDKLFVDGFVSFGVGRNNLSLSNGVLALDSEYVTRTTTFGGSLSGIIEKSGYEIWPEFSFSYGQTSIGSVGFTGKAFGLVDNALSLDASTVKTMNVMFRPEFRMSLDGEKASNSLKTLTFAPRIICEQVQAKTAENNCGGGAEIGISTRSEDGMANINAKIVADRIGNRTQSNLQLNLMFRF